MDTKSHLTLTFTRGESFLVVGGHGVMFVRLGMSGLDADSSKVALEILSVCVIGCSKSASVSSEPIL
ncbi:hypothetical protein J6590_041074 [Homalodisca vitripennis]|nr:hypothetical protein J6590_041074 [Homalodisca vitripennis]